MQVTILSLVGIAATHRYPEPGTTRGTNHLSFSLTTPYCQVMSSPKGRRTRGEAVDPAWQEPNR
jgi:hypothetical protein